MRSPSGKKGYVRDMPAPGGVMGWRHRMEDEDDRLKAEDPLDTDDQDLAERQAEFTTWDDATLDDREDAELCRDFFDNYQWTDQELEDFYDRGQPVVTKNLIAPLVNEVVGTEMDNAVDPYAKPQTDMDDLEREAIVDALRYCADKDDFDNTRDEGAQELSLEGSCFGLLVAENDGQFPEPSETGQQNIDFEIMHVPWDRAYWDPRSRRKDFSDARYMGVFDWFYRDDVEAEFLTDDLPDEEYARREEAIAGTYGNMGGTSTQDRPRRRWMDNRNNRVRVFETYYRKGRRWYRCTWMHSGFLIPPSPVPFQTDRGDSFNPMFGTSAFITRDNTRYGWVKNLISQQEEVNKRGSKAMHEVMTDKFIAERGAIPEPDAFIEESQRADGIAEVAPGALRDQRFIERPKSEIVATQMQMQDRAEAGLSAVGPGAGVDAADSNGRAQMVRQQRGALRMRPFSKALRRFTLAAYRRYYWMIRQYWTEEKWLRIRDDEKAIGYRMVALNHEIPRGERLMELIERGQDVESSINHAMGPEGLRMFRRISQELQIQQKQMQAQYQQVAAQAQQMGQQPPPPPQMKSPLQALAETDLGREPFRFNDTARLDVDIILDTAPDGMTIRAETYASVTELFGQSPMLHQNPKAVQELFRLHPGLRPDERRRLSSTLESPPPDPAAGQAAQQQMQMQMKVMEAAVAESQAKVARAQAEMQRVQSEMQLAIAKMPHEVAKLQAETAKVSAQAQKDSQEASLGVPAAAHLDHAQAGLAEANAQAVPSEVHHNEARAAKAAADAAGSVADRVMTPRGIP